MAKFTVEFDSDSAEYYANIWWLIERAAPFLPGRSFLEFLDECKSYLDEDRHRFAGQWDEAEEIMMQHIERGFDEINERWGKSQEPGVDK